MSLKYQKPKPRLDDSAAAAASLLNHGLREIVTSKSTASHIFQSPLFTGGNLRRQPSVLLINKSTQRIAVCYSAKRSALDLFAVGTPSARALRNDPRRYARAFVIAHWHDDAAAPVIQEWHFSVRARMEILRGFGAPLSADEQEALRALLLGEPVYA